MQKYQVNQTLIEGLALTAVKDPELLPFLRYRGHFVWDSTKVTGSDGFAVSRLSGIGYLITWRNPDVQTQGR
jgi:hypothetical protein